MFENLFRRGPASTDPLDVATVPGNRRVNNVPLFVGGALLVIFLAIMAYVMMERANQSSSNGPNAEKAKKEANATRFAKDITGPWAGGMIPPNQPAAPTVPTLPALNPPAATTTPAPLNLPAVEGNLPVRPYSPEEQMLRNQRLQSFQAALAAKTGVQTSEMRSRQVTQRNTAQQDVVRRQMTGANDATAAYQAKVAQLRGGGDGTAGFPSSGAETGGKKDNSMSRYSRDNKWGLQQEVEAPATPYELRAGFVLPALMISGINSDLPGQVMAQVSQNVYDTATGKYLLIPQGTRLIGTYNSDVAYGQERVLMAWQRLVFPDGKALDIEAMPGADSAGMAGFNDRINNHYFRTFSSAFLLSGIIAAVSMSQDQQRSNSNNNNSEQRASDALSQSLGQTLGTAMAEMIRKNMNVSPTLEIRPGYRFNVMVVKDMRFKSPYRSFDYQE